MNKAIEFLVMAGLVVVLVVGASDLLSTPAGQPSPSYRADAGPPRETTGASPSGLVTAGLFLGVFVAGGLASYRLLKKAALDWTAHRTQLEKIRLAAERERAEIDRLRAEANQAEHDAKRKEIESRYSVIPGGGHCVVYDPATHTFREFEATPHKLVGNDSQTETTHSPAPPTEDDETLLDALSPVSRLLLVGGMGTGKTELLRHLCDAHARVIGREGRVLILDPHAGPETWPVPNVSVIGRGRDYGKIADTFRQVCAEMDRRYKQIANGDRNPGEFPGVVLVVDEFTTLTAYCDVAGEIRALLCEARKANIALIVAGQNDSVAALGLKQGESKLRHGFEAVAYLHKGRAGDRWGTVTFGTERDGTKYRHPGIYRARWAAPSFSESAPFSEGPGGRDRGEEAEKSAWSRAAGTAGTAIRRLLPAPPTLTPEAARVRGYIRERGGEVSRQQLLTSRILGGVKEYDRSLDVLIRLGQLQLNRGRNRKNDTYRLNTG